MPTQDSAELSDLKKSSSPQKAVTGNVNKYESYREAWSRIKHAQGNGFFLEAITIQESIISDRLIVFLARPEAENRLCKDRKGRWPSFGQIIERWRKSFPDEQAFPAGLEGRVSNLVDEVDQWRCDRNQAIHAIVKSDPGQPTQNIDLFLQQAKEVAERGERLAKAVSNWQRRQ
jgi:hypothetical protein